MFSILLGFFDTTTQDFLEDFCKKCHQINVYSASTKEEWFALFEQQEFDCFFFRFEEDLMNVRNVIYSLRSDEQHQHTPIILFSTKIEFLITAFVHWRSCECFLLPFDNEKKEALSSLLHYYVGMYQKMHLAQRKFFQVNTPKGLYNLPYNDILYVESAMKKSIVHLKSDAIHVPYPLYQVRKLIPEKNFVQTHRSFIVNLDNISYVDKSKEPWGIFFFGSDKEAFVSRSHKKTLPPFFQGTDDENQ
ncbi:LytR/AlgR family response regulator transcription factor [Anaerotignum sp. MB30-C6]|uniref:LytR/AlgR family response regulator transcription factor n=1 Tax=Anaerotignum sp. MB30-C6 TaxID=3070814 RepID=UPI0027DCDC25|nr:LytTR family DNA-binding domain-containing protein [Anaerotignum sp. MB30-C6]WMI80168.1 LytTR family DNA-binding domain-containing protein [Anaerotignum sp. MB30-C6]